MLALNAILVGIFITAYLYTQQDLNSKIVGRDVVAKSDDSGTESFGKSTHRNQITSRPRFGISNLLW